MSDLVTVAIITAAPPTIIGILNFVMSIVNRRKLHEVAANVDGNLSATQAVAKKLGVEKDALGAEVERLSQGGLPTPQTVDQDINPAPVSMSETGRAQVKPKEKP